MRQPTRARHLNPAGFTLLQLLVVVTIIGLVSTIATVASQRAVFIARDAHRVHALREVQAALEQYWIDNRQYPYAPAWRKSCILISPGVYGYDPNYIPGLVPKYMAELPKDPLPCTHEGYYYRSNGTNYSFQSHNESSTQRPGGLLLKFLDTVEDGGPDCHIIDPPSPAYSWQLEHFAISNSPDAACWTEW